MNPDINSIEVLIEIDPIGWLFDLSNDHRKLSSQFDGHLFDIVFSVRSDDL